MAHKWAHWLHHLCHLGGRQHFRVRDKISSGPQMGRLAASHPLPSVHGPRCFQEGDKISSGPQVGRLATSPLPSRPSPMLQSWGQNKQWWTSGKSGCMAPAILGVPQCFKAKGKIMSGRQVGSFPTSPCHLGAPQCFRTGGQNQRWLTSGQIGSFTPSVRGIPNASQSGTKSTLAKN